MGDILPTNGRVVLFTPRQGDRYYTDFVDHGRAPWTAHVCHVHSPRLVNLMVIHPEGYNFSETSVQLVQPDDSMPEGGRYCEWMEYQKGQAAKYDTLTPRVTALEEGLKALQGAQEAQKTTSAANPT